MQSDCCIALMVFYYVGLHSMIASCRFSQRVLQRHRRQAGVCHCSFILVCGLLQSVISSALFLAKRGKCGRAGAAKCVNDAISWSHFTKAFVARAHCHSLLSLSYIVDPQTDVTVQGCSLFIMMWLALLYWLSDLTEIFEFDSDSFTTPGNIWDLRRRWD